MPPRSTLWRASASGPNVTSRVLHTNQNVVISAVQAAAEAGIAAAARDSGARGRLTAMRDFYAFLLAEIPAQRPHHIRMNDPEPAWGRILT